MNFGPNTAPKFFESEDEESKSAEDNLFERVDAWLIAQGISPSDPADIIDDAFDDIRRKTYSEMSSVCNIDGLSAQSTSPFFLSSPLTSSIVLERHVPLHRGLDIGRRITYSPKVNEKTLQVPSSSVRKIEKVNNSSFFPGPVSELSPGNPKPDPEISLNVKARASRGI
jgi:hypothetical protein